MDEIFVREIDMPTSIKGMSVLDEDGNYNVYINHRLSFFARRETYQHELRHIRNDDFYREADIKEKEQLGH